MNIEEETLQRAAEMFTGDIPAELRRAFNEADPILRDLIIEWWRLVAQKADGSRLNFGLGLAGLNDHPSRPAFEDSFLQLQEFWATAAAMTLVLNELTNEENN